MQWLEVRYFDTLKKLVVGTVLLSSLVGLRVHGGPDPVAGTREVGNRDGDIATKARVAATAPSSRTAGRLIWSVGGVQGSASEIPGKG